MEGISPLSGPKLEKVVGWNKVVLIGDASHPLTGKRSAVLHS
jgi:salicylate hydroxylase